MPAVNPFDPPKSDKIRTRYHEESEDWGAVTGTVEYEDGGAAHNENSDHAPIIFTVEWKDYLTEAEAATIDDFYKEKKLSQSFSFQTRDRGTYTNVFFLEKPVKQHQFQDQQTRVCKLIYRPCEGSLTLNTPVQLAVTSIGQTAATLNWEASTAPAGMEVSGYEYRLDGGSAVDVGDVLTKALTGLTPTTEYDAEVRAYDSSGASTVYSAWSNVKTFTTDSPVAPVQTAATGVGDQIATLNWNAAAGADTYEYRYKVGAGAFGSWTNVGAVLTVNLTGLTNDSLHTSEIRAISGGSPSASSNQITFTPTPPPLLLDDITTSVLAAWSIGRKLRNAYAGSAIRLRRSSDGTEQDIGFDSNGDLDVGDAFFDSSAYYNVTKIYNQANAGTPSDYDLIPVGFDLASSTNRMRFAANSGDYGNNNPTLSEVKSRGVFMDTNNDGNKDRSGLQINRTGTADWELTIPFTLCMVLGTPKSGHNGANILNYAPSNNILPCIEFDSSNNFILKNGGTDRTFASGVASGEVNFQGTFKFRIGNDSVFVNGSEVGTAANCGDTQRTDGHGMLGRGDGSNSYAAWSGHFMEGILLDATFETGDQDTIEDSQDTYWTIP